MQPINTTPFAMDAAVIFDKNGAEHFLIALKATYSIQLVGAQASLHLAETQQPLQPGDSFTQPDKPEQSSIAQEAEMGPPKPATDLFLHGFACAPHAQANAVELRFRVGAVEKRAAVFGDRFWLRQMASPVASQARPFDKIALIYENGFGGVDQSPDDPSLFGAEARNPVGRGFRAKQSKRPWEQEQLPNIEEIGNLLSHPEQQVNPVGFGPIGRHWQPRMGYAGTYDQQWSEQRMPLLPLDFDERFHQAAAPDLIYPGYVQGGESVLVQGCTHGGSVSFLLPVVRAQARIRLRSGDAFPELHCQSVSVDMERMELRLLWKAVLNVHRKLHHIQEYECRLDNSQANEHPA